MLTIFSKKVHSNALQASKNACEVVAQKLALYETP